MRTARDFVRDLCKRGKTDTQIRGIACNTQWHNQMDDVSKFIQKRAERWRNNVHNKEEVHV